MQFSQKILVVVAHPDDEVLGSGGLIHNLAERRKRVNVAIVCPRSVTAREGVGEKYARTLMNQAYLAANELGIKDLYFGEFKHELSHPSISRIEVNRWVASVIFKDGCDTVITHAGKELHQDHNIVSEAVSIAARPRGNKNIEVLHCEPIGAYPHEFWPNLYAPLSEEDVEAKIKALACYEGEVQKQANGWRTLEGIRAKAKIRGIESGTDWAEAFSIWRCYS